MLKAYFFRNKVQKSRKTDTDNADYVRVIGVGLPRTGTSSVKAALELLGFGPCYHMSELFDKNEHAKQFIRAYNHENIDFHALLKGYGSTMDTPAADFYKEIHQAYPRAKLLLTVRDSGEEWFKSVDGILPVLASNVYYFAVYPMDFLRQHCIAARLVYKKWLADYGGFGPWIHDRHNARVLKENEEKDILVFNVKEGWSPLCKFLDVDIPEKTPFPVVNDSLAIKRQIIMSQNMGWCVWIFISTITFIIIYLFIKLVT